VWRQFPAIVDGEIIELARSATVEFVEAGFLALAPADAATETERSAARPSSET